jgi:putative ABC transport system ATP-binding protein
MDTTPANRQAGDESVRRPPGLRREGGILAGAAADAAGCRGVTAAPMVRLVSVTKVYGRGDRTVEALRDVSLAFFPGTFSAVMGPSGSGKSSLLQCAAGLDRPTFGQVLLGETDLTRLGEARLARLRRQRIGFVFQAFNLVPSLTAEQNITLPLRLARRGLDHAWLGEVAERLGIVDRLGHRPGQLSGGEQQRVAIARALITRPAVVFADEPTGALDSASGQQILRLLRAAVDDLGQCLVMVTHDPRAAACADRVLFLSDGRVAGEMEAPGAAAIADRMALPGG